MLDWVVLVSAVFAAPPVDTSVPGHLLIVICVAALALMIRTALLAGLYNKVVPAQRSSVVKPGEWSLTDHLEHILRADAHYVGCLSDQLPGALSPMPEADLAFKLLENGRNYETLLRGLTPSLRTRIYTHEDAEWTLAKTLRRMTKHLREHYPWMQEVAD